MEGQGGRGCRGEEGGREGQVRREGWMKGVTEGGVEGKDGLGRKGGRGVGRREGRGGGGGGGRRERVFPRPFWTLSLFSIMSLVYHVRSNLTCIILC